MNQEKQLSITDIIRELNTGTATTKFILKRFNKWLPFDRIDGLHSYSRQTIPILIKIKEYLDSGMLPSEIEQELENPSQADFTEANSMEANSMGTNSIDENPMEANPVEDIEKHFLEQPNEDIRLSKDGLSLIKSIFNDIKGTQDRIAIAHEKRAEAEQRKAVSIEKRAEAEEKKAIAMNNIANALQEMNQHRIQDGETKEIALQSVQALAVDETEVDETNSEIDDLLDAVEPDEVEQNEADVLDIPATPFDMLETSDIEMDDLSALVDVDEDLVPASDKDETPVDDIELESLDTDDLSLLLDDSIPQPDEFNELDDLSALIDSVSAQEDSDSATDSDPDFNNNEAHNDEAPMDDLSALIDDKKENIGPNTARENALEEPMDDLAALVDETPSLKPDITPQEDIAKYKAVVMKIILGLKSEGYSAEKTTKRLNKDKIQTLSGKPGWSEKAISQIYKFIDSAK